MKLIQMLLIFMMVVLSAVFVVATHSGSGWVDPAAVSSPVGNTATVTLKVNNPGNAASFIALDLIYNPVIISMSSQTGTSNPDVPLLSSLQYLPAATVSFSNIDATHRRLRFGVDNGQLGTLPPGVIDVARIRFTGVSAGMFPLDLAVVNTPGITQAHDAEITVTAVGCTTAAHCSGSTPNCITTSSDSSRQGLCVANGQVLIGETCTNLNACVTGLSCTGGVCVSQTPPPRFRD